MPKRSATTTSRSKHDPVEHPRHYTAHPSGVECIEITRHMNFNLGNVVKYLWREGLKGYPLEDLRKAAFYLRDEIARVEARLAAAEEALRPTAAGTGRRKRPQRSRLTRKGSRE